MKVTVFMANDGYKEFEADIEAIDSLHGQLNDNCEFITVKAIDGEHILAKDHIVSIDVANPSSEYTVDTRDLDSGDLKITIGRTRLSV